MIRYVLAILTWFREWKYRHFVFAALAGLLAALSIAGDSPRWPLYAGLALLNLWSGISVLRRANDGDQHERE